MQILWNKQAVLADQFAIKGDGAAAVFGALDADEVPVDL